MTTTRTRYAIAMTVVMSAALCADRVAVAALGPLGLICTGLLRSGLHALLAYAVARRQRAIGIRVALGAGRSRVVMAVLARVFMVLGVGIAVGVGLASGTGALVSSMIRVRASA